MPSFAALLANSGKAEGSQKTRTPKPNPETAWMRTESMISGTGRYDVFDIFNTPSFEKDTQNFKGQLFNSEPLR